MRLPLYEDLSLQIGHPAKERLPTPPGSTAPTYFDPWCGFFYFSQEPDRSKWSETGPFLVRKALCPNSNRKCLFITCRAKMWKVDGLRHQWKHSSQSISLSLSLLLVVWLESCWQQLQFTWWWEGMTASSFWRAKSTRKLKKPRQRKCPKNDIIRFYEQNNSSAHTSRCWVHFLDIHSTTTPWNLLMWHSIEEVNIWQTLFLLLFWTWIKSFSIQLQETSPSFDKSKGFK